MFLSPFMGLPCPSYNLFNFTTIIILFIAFPHALRQSSGATCGSEKPCVNGLCCSQYGFCGNTSAFCGDGCISSCNHVNTSTSSSHKNGSEAVVAAAITNDIFDQFFYAQNESDCPARGFYNNRSSFLLAASTFPAFGTSGGFNSSRRELAAFFAYASQVTGGGCFVEATGQTLVGCTPTPQWGCASGKKYYGRGPLQIAWNTNYGPIGDAVGFDGINDPDLVAEDPIVSFRASLWFWMTPQPFESYSCHEAILTPSQGFKQVVTILNGGPLKPESLQQRTAAYRTFYAILTPTANVSSIAPSPITQTTTTGVTGAQGTTEEKSCIGSLCGTRSKVIGLAMPLALGGIAVVVLVFLAAVLHWHKGRGDSKGHTQFKLEKIQGLAGNPINFGYATLESATKSFSTVLGQGGFGLVYKGVLPSGEAIAVKVLNESTHNQEQFLREIETLGKFHHVNVVRLVGFCIERSKKILVYEFISNSSLEKHLFKGSNNGGQIDNSELTWEKRYEIALGIARGLSYIHEECLHTIIHRDMKPQNVLLDDLFCPKISDFGLAKIIRRDESKVVSYLKGTPGYVAPEFWSRRGELSTKFDVYSFGMLALELVSGRPNFKEDLPSEQAYFPDWVVTNVCSPRRIVDHRIANEANLSQVQLLVYVALWCIQDDPAQRPSMSRVVQYLEGIVDVPSNLPNGIKVNLPVFSSNTSSSGYY